jgi:hypothetical protein
MPADDRMAAIRALAMEESYLAILALYQRLPNCGTSTRLTRKQRRVYDSLAAEIRAAVEMRRVAFGEEMVSVGVTAEREPA